LAAHCVDCVRGFCGFVREVVLSHGDASMEQPPLPASGPADAPPWVLIADHNPQGVELLDAYLSGSDYEIRTCADGEETLRQVKDWRPDLILLDIMMPKISGFEVCKRLRADPASRDIAVLMLA